MTKYRAAVDFVDLQDGRHSYHAGDTFPRAGLTVDAARLSELAGSDNRARKPLIVAVEEPDAAPEEMPEQPVKRRVKRRD